MTTGRRKELKKNFGCILVLVLFFSFHKVSTFVYGDNGGNINASGQCIKESYIYGIKNITLIVFDDKLQQATGGNELVLCTFDNKHKKVKLTSILKDTCVKTPDGGFITIGKLSSERSVRYINDALNNSFNLRLMEYAKVDLIKLVNVVGSVQLLAIDIKEEEVPYMKGEGIGNKGIHYLTSNQALTFTRIPDGNIGGRERSDRVRMVLAKCFQNVKSQPTKIYLPLIYLLIPCIESNIDSCDMVQIGMNVLTTTKADLKEQRVPFDNHMRNQCIKGVNYVMYDEKYTKERLYNNIYEDISLGE